jgi:uncharacterized protein
MEDKTLSTGRMPTDRPARYGKQVISHLGRRAVGEWNDETLTGTLTFENGVGVAEFSCEQGALTIDLRAPAELIPKFESVVGDHLVRFGTRDDLIVRWTRSDGSPGSVQSNAPSIGDEPR